jgi:hypothetical protein
MNATNKPVKTNSKEFLAHVNAYILDCIDSEAYEVETTTDLEKLQFLADTFKNEYSHGIKYYSSAQEAMRQYIMGLPSVFNVAWENYRILEIAQRWGSLGADATEKEQDKILANWFNLIAAKTLQLMAKHHIYIN